MSKPGDRRAFLLYSGLSLSAAACRRLGSSARAQAAPRRAAVHSSRPQLAQGIQIGDVCGERAIVWSRSDRPARLLVEWDVSDRFRDPRLVSGPHALEASDFTARVDLTRLPPDREIFLRVQFRDLSDQRALSEPVFGQFRSAPLRRSAIRFLWSGDTAGQGFGINPEFGGMRIYETMRERAPDFFIHSGDTIYADAPLPAEKMVEDGRIWRNLVTPEKSKVAETLDEFRGNYRYNLLDANVRRFNAEVPQIWQWDDHEVTNNWSASKDLSRNLNYREKRVPLLAARAARAFLEYAPLRTAGDEELERVYRQISYGPLLDVFVVDMRSYRGPNGENRQLTAGEHSQFFGRPQLAWLKRGLSSSRALWKIVAADMPLGLLVRDGQDARGRDLFEGIANGAGPPLGRELELAELLRFLKQSRVDNVVWLTADVHYAAAHYYDPSKAKFRDFSPFWEFVAGPLHAGSFGPSELDDTFGPQVVFQRAPPTPNASPFAGYQSFGEVSLDLARKSLQVALIDLDGRTVFEQTLASRR